MRRVGCVLWKMLIKGFRVPLKGSFKGFLNGIYTGSIKGLGFRVSENRGYLILGVP